ncbi:protoporphyrinogen oxidase [Nesterenkonia alba]|uniref:protoporphyrinogen oxidase n=1 Tax=Nesterenkonia alba TaxID=515814 RepID=UPI0003B42490|nr:protoporphyrinogen oxidase [Nesterenkonia alba]
MSIAVIGGGVAGLVAAWELASAGAEVEVFEAEDHLGGAVCALPMASGRITLDAGAEAFATRSPEVPRLLEDLGLSAEIVPPHPGPAWLQLPDIAGPLPAAGVLGIPVDPQAEDVIRLIGPEAAARAAEDLTAMMTWGAEDSPTLGAVVRDRMGDDVAEKLVAPIASGVYSTDPDDLDLATAAPGLYAAMLSHGSLARAAAAIRAESPSGSAVASLRGGMHRLPAALESRLRALGVRLHLNTPMDSLTDLDAQKVLLALDGPAASALAAGTVQVPQLTPRPEDDGAERGVALVTLVLHAPELDARPRGTGMLVARDAPHIGAKAMTHITAKWEWASRHLHTALGEGHHAVRLSYGRISDTDGQGLGFSSTDEQLLQAAAGDVSALFSVDISPECIVDSAVVRWQRALPPSAAGHRRRVQSFRGALAAQRAGSGPQLWTAGAWFAGTGLARVIPDARETAREILTST